jgi:hypothetical protein
MLALNSAGPQEESTLSFPQDGSSVCTGVSLHREKQCKGPEVGVSEFTAGGKQGRRTGQKIAAGWGRGERVEAHPHPSFALRPHRPKKSARAAPRVPHRSLINASHKCWQSQSWQAKSWPETQEDLGLAPQRRRAWEIRGGGLFHPQGTQVSLSLAGVVHTTWIPSAPDCRLGGLCKEAHMPWGCPTLLGVVTQPAS